MSFVQLNSKQAFVAQHPHRPSEEFDIFISWVNSNPHISWKANTCLLSPHHKDYDCGNAPDHQNLVQIDAPVFGEGEIFKQALDKVQQF